MAVALLVCRDAQPLLCWYAETHGRASLPPTATYHCLLIIVFFTPAFAAGIRFSLTLEILSHTCRRLSTAWKPCRRFAGDFPKGLKLRCRLQEDFAGRHCSPATCSEVVFPDTVFLQIAAELCFTTLFSCRLQQGCVHEHCSHAACRKVVFANNVFLQVAEGLCSRNLFCQDFKLCNCGSF